jgi:hypothetical protein
MSLNATTINDNLRTVQSWMELASSVKLGRFKKSKDRGCSLSAWSVIYFGAQRCGSSRKAARFLIIHDERLYNRSKSNAL